MNWSISQTPLHPKVSIPTANENISRVKAILASEKNSAWAHGTFPQWKRQTHLHRGIPFPGRFFTCSFTGETTKTAVEQIVNLSCSWSQKAPACFITNLDYYSIAWNAHFFHYLLEISKRDTQIILVVYLLQYGKQ